MMFTKRSSMEEIDKDAIRKLYDELNCYGLWSVFRHGSPGRPVRLEMVGLTKDRPRKRFEKIRAQMMQGSVYLVDPQGIIVDHGFEPMVRTRW